MNLIKHKTVIPLEGLLNFCKLVGTVRTDDCITTRRYTSYPAASL